MEMLYLKKKRGKTGVTYKLPLNNTAISLFNNPFMIWGKYKRGLFKTTLTVSFQFHHTQMDGAHAALFLSRLQAEIDSL